jgi:hypothetical protein
MLLGLFGIGTTEAILAALCCGAPLFVGVVVGVIIFAAKQGEKQSK